MKPDVDDLHRHGFYATPGPERLPGWTNRCDVCGGPYSAPQHQGVEQSVLDANVLRAVLGER
jgi:hypothetical protein